MTDGVKTVLATMEATTIVKIVFNQVGILCKSVVSFIIMHAGTLQTHKWENAFTIDKKSWGFRREATLSDYLTMDELIKDLAITVR